MRIISWRSSLSSSRILLLASTTSVGSMNTVRPDALSSCTIPCIFRFSAGATGITKRPSRMVGATSFSTMPSACAERRMPPRMREMEPSTRASSRRICASSGDAVSRMCPNLSIIWSICCTKTGNVAMPSARSCSAGQVHRLSEKSPSSALSALANGLSSSAVPR